MQLLSPLPFNAYSQAAPLFQPLDFHLAVPAALAGIAPSQLWVDDPQNPRSALLRIQHHLFLAGSADNARFNEAIYHLLEGTFFPAHPQDGFVITWEDPAWEPILQQVILRDHPPIPGARQYYALDLTQWPGLPTSLPSLPQGLSFHPVDPTLTTNQRLTNLADLLEELLSERPTVADFLDKSFGMCIVSADLVVTWCLSEYNLGGRCEVGIATHPQYRGQGLATLTGQAFLRQALENGATHIGWHCWTSNEPSSRTALKIGLRKERDYPSAFLLADRATHLAVHGDICLNQGDFPAAVEWLERAFQAGAAPAWAYKTAACAYARLAKPSAAFHCLELALQKGFNNRAELEENKHLQALRSSPQWVEILSKLPS